MEGILIINNDGVALKSTMSAEQTSQYSAEMSRVSTTTSIGLQIHCTAPTMPAVQLCAMARSSVRTLDASVSSLAAAIAPVPNSCVHTTAERPHILKDSIKEA